MVIMLLCAYLSSTVQSKTTATGHAILEVQETLHDKYIVMDATVFYDNYIDMREAADFEVSADGLQLYFADGTGYYWKRWKGRRYEDMRINGARQFRGNDGNSYLVQDAHKADTHKGKYILTVKVNGVYKLCYDMFYKLLYFNTIKDAQREVLYSADFIRTM